MSHKEFPNPTDPSQESADTAWIRTLRERGSFPSSTTAIRLGDGTSRRAFAEKIEITPTTLAKYEEGKSADPQTKIVNRIIDVSELDSDSLAAQYYRAQSRDTEIVSINEIGQSSYTFGEVVVYTRTLGGLNQEDVSTGFEWRNSSDISRLEKDEVGPDITDAAGLISVLDLPENDPLRSVIVLKAERPTEPVADEVTRELLGSKYLVKEYMLSIGGYPISPADRELLTRLDERETELRAEGSTDVVGELVQLLPPPERNNGRATNESTRANGNGDKALEVVKELDARGFDIHHPITHMILDVVERPEVPKWNEMDTQQQWEAVIFSLPKETRLQKSFQYVCASLGSLTDIEGIDRSTLEHVISGKRKPDFATIRQLIAMSPMENDGLVEQQLRLDKVGMDPYSAYTLDKLPFRELFPYTLALVGMTERQLAIELGTTAQKVNSWKVPRYHPTDLDADVLIEKLTLSQDSVLAKVLKASLYRTPLHLTPEDIEKAKKEKYLLKENEKRNISFRLPATDSIKIYDIEGTSTRLSLEGSSNVVGQTLGVQREKEGLSYSAMLPGRSPSTYQGIEKKGAVANAYTMGEIAANLGMPLPHPGACLLIDLSAAERAKR